MQWSQWGRQMCCEKTEQHFHIRIFSTGAALPATQMKWLCNVCARCYSQVQGIEEKDNIFAFVVGQLQLLEFTVNYGCSLPVWCRLWNWRRKDTRIDKMIDPFHTFWCYICHLFAGINDALAFKWPIETLIILCIFTYLGLSLFFFFSYFIIHVHSGRW